MKKYFLLLLVAIMLGCEPEDILLLGNELLEKKYYQVGLTRFCSGSELPTWYCVSKDEYNRLKEITPSCETITITSTKGNKYSGINNGNYFKHVAGYCST